MIKEFLQQIVKCLETLIMLQQMSKQGVQSSKTEQRKEVVYWIKNQVLEVLKISERTYYHYIQNQILKPRRICGIDYFLPEDIEKAMKMKPPRGRKKKKK